MLPEQAASQRVALVDAVNRLLDRGVVIQGGAVISLAEVDLAYLDLRLMLSSVETLRESVAASAARSLPTVPRELLAPGPAPRSKSEPTRGADRRSLPASTSRPARAILERWDEDARSSPSPALSRVHSRPESGLAQLVLTLVELLRQVLEHQALRRVEGGELTEETVERMGEALMQLEEKMDELRNLFGLEKEDLQLDLGPLGELLR